MAVVYSVTLKSARLAAVVSALGTAGKLEIGTSAMGSVLATFTLANPAGTVTGDELAFDFVADSVNAANTGTAAAARMRTSANADVVTGLTVGTSGTDIVLNSTSITSGQQVTVVSAVVTHG
jgi:hypothetical protein